MKKKYWIIIRVILILLIPFILSFIIIPNKPIDLDLVEGDNETYRKVSIEDIYNPNSWIDNFNKLLGVPFDLNYYHFCFEDINTTVINGEDIEFTFSKWDILVRFNNYEENLTMGTHSKNCTKNSFFIEDKVFFDSKLEYIILIHYRISSLEKSSILPNTKVYATPNKKTLWIKRVIFIISILSLIWLSTRIRLIIQKGWGKC